MVIHCMLMQSCTSLCRNTVCVHEHSIQADAKLRASGTEDKFQVHGYLLYVDAKLYITLPEQSRQFEHTADLFACTIWAQWWSAGVVIGKSWV